MSDNKTELTPESLSPQAFYKRMIEALEAERLPTQQTWIADQLGIYQSAVAKWKGGEGFPTLENLVRLSQITNRGVGYLLTGREGRRGDELDELMRALLEIWDRLSLQAKQELLDFAKFKLPPSPPHK